MKKVCLMLLGALVLLGFAGCQGGSSVRDRMEEAEALMDSRPDSARFILENIDVKYLDTKRLKAERSLLLSMALDKSYTDLTSDTLINVAVDYYRRHKDYEKLFQSLYYQGRVYENAGQYSKAMLSFTEAEQIIDEVENDFAKGLLYAQLGRLYDRFYNFQKSLEYFTLAGVLYNKANRLFHYYNTRLSIGCVYVNSNQSTIAERILKDVIEWSRTKDVSMYNAAKSLLGTLYKRTGNVSDYLALHGENNALPSDNAALAYYYAVNDIYPKALDCLNLAWEDANCFQDTIRMYECSYRVNKELGNYETALLQYEKLMLIQDTTMRSVVQQPLIEVQKDYFYSQAENHALKLRSNRILLVSGCVIAILAFILIIVYYRYRLINKQRKLDDYIALYQELEDKISQKDSEIDAMHIQLKHLFANKYELLNQLCQISYENPGSSIKGAIYTKVVKEIDAFKSDNKFYAKLEDIVNEYNDNVMRELREGMPNLSSQEYNMFCYICAGFSTKAISIFMDEPTANLYMKKKRLKEKILKKKPQGWQKMMKYIE